MIKRVRMLEFLIVVEMSSVLNASAGEVVGGSPMTEWWLQGPGVPIVLGTLACMLCLIVLGIIFWSRRLNQIAKTTLEMRGKGATLTNSCRRPPKGTA